MMRFTPLLALILALILGLSLPVSAQIHFINEQHDQARDSVKRYGKGDTLVVQYDSVYLFNRTQVTYYDMLMKLKVTVTKDNKSLEKMFTDLLNKMTMNLAELDDLSKKMKINADSTNAVGRKLVDKTYESVDKTNQLIVSSKILLDSADAKLKRADLHLEKAETLIKDAKKKQRWERLKWGGLGVLVGVLVGIIFK